MENAELNALHAEGVSDLEAWLADRLGASLDRLGASLDRLCPSVVAPAAAVTLGGTVAFALLLDSATVSPPPGAAPLNVTVHADVPGAFTLPGLQLTPDGTTAATVIW